MILLLLGVHAAAMRSPAPRLTRDLSPAEVVAAQLDAFANDDLQASFQFASPANRRSRGTL